MSTWKELPRPATPGPWTPFVDDDDFWLNGMHRADTDDWRAVRHLPDYVAEVDRLRAWVDTRFIVDWEIADRIRAGEWPEGIKP